ncbi:unnamed protein product [Ectocarpus sp. 12 AP-2014]
MVRFIVNASAAFALLLSFSTVEASRKKHEESIEFTVFERQSDDGPRHSPLFTLPVPEAEDVEYPSKMVLFNNDLYGSEDDLIDEVQDELIGYNQGHCVETVASGGFIAECFFTYVFDDGSLTANGPFNFDVEDGVLPSFLAVTGGTGEYDGTLGCVEVSAGPAEEFPSLQFDFKLKKKSRE